MWIVQLAVGYLAFCGTAPLTLTAPAFPVCSSGIRNPPPSQDCFQQLDSEPSPPPTSVPFLAGDHLRGEFKMTKCLLGKEL